MINEILMDMINYFQTDAKRIQHTLKVYQFASIISAALGITGDKAGIIGYAAVLHDIGIKEAERKHNSAAGPYQEAEGPPVAEAILGAHQISRDIIERVCFIVGNHHSYDKIDGVDFQIIVEADFLVNIFESGMNGESIVRVYRDYFKTAAGRRIMKTIYAIEG